MKKIVFFKHIHFEKNEIRVFKAYLIQKQRNSLFREPILVEINQFSLFFCITEFDKNEIFSFYMVKFGEK